MTTTAVKKKKNLRPKFHVRRGDIVKVITGEHKGSQGKILEVQTKKQRVIIEGVRLIKKHARRSNDNPTGGIIEREGAIHVSNVTLVERPTATDAKGKSK
jgi:large subunit ribosomal protein L24